MVMNITSKFQDMHSVESSFVSPEYQHHLNAAFSTAAAEVFKNQSASSSARAMVDSLNHLTESAKDDADRKQIASEMQV